MLYGKEDELENHGTGGIYNEIYKAYFLLKLNVRLFFRLN